MSKHRHHNRPGARAGNPVEWAIMRASLTREVQDLINTADIQASWGNSPAGTIDRCGRVLFVIAFAVGRCGVSEDLPEVRVLRAMANVVEQLSHDHSSLEQHRGALSSGLQAVQRLLPRLSVWSIGEGSLVLDQLRQQGASVTIGQVQSLIQAPAAIAPGVQGQRTAGQPKGAAA